MINVSNIERFAIHDGPGIRTTIFLQGCSLHCPWCANPETWTSYPVLMHDVTKCIHCHHCQSICEKRPLPFHSIGMKRNVAIVIDVKTNA